MILQGRKIYGGKIEGRALVTHMGISFFGGVDAETGIIAEKGHDLEGQSVQGKILVFPAGKGSTVGSYILYRLKKAGLAPLGIINMDCEAIIAVGCIISEIPCVDQIDIAGITNGMHLYLDADEGNVEILD
jgi:uncharacterized protein